MPPLRLTAAILLLATVPAAAMQGKLFLVNGKALQGDINRTEDGGYWVTVKSGSLKLERDEVKRVVIYSKNDGVREKFISSFRITPGRKPAPKSAAGPYSGDKVQKRFMDAFRVTPGQPSAGKAATTPYDNIINAAAKRNHIDPALIKAVIKAESNFNPYDTSNKGACGLMQLMPETAKGLGVKSIYAPAENIGAGSRYLGYMLQMYNGDLERALAAYNAGPGAVNKYRRVPPYQETQNYVKTVKRYYTAYRKGRTLHSYTDPSGRLTIYNVP